MDHDQREALAPVRLGLPVAMAQHSASILRVHLHGFRIALHAKGRPGKIIAYDGLEMAVAQAEARLKLGKPLRSPAGSAVKLLFLLGFWVHGDSAIRPTGLITSPAVRVNWGG